MTEGVSRRRAAVDVCALLIGTAAIAAYALDGTPLLPVVGAYGLLLGTSTAVVTYSLVQFTGLSVTDDGSTDTTRSLRAGAWRIFTGRALRTDSEADTGWLIGRLENILVLTLVLVGAYTALSVIFAAKSFVRYEDTASRDSTYYLAGTLVNFTYSIAVGLVTTQVVG